MDTEFFAQRLQCSRSDKQDCLLTVRQLLEIAFFYREHTPVELDRFMQDRRTIYTDHFLRRAVSCLVDVGNNDLIRQVLTNYILVGNYTGHKFLKNVVIMETILALHKNMNLDHIFSFLVPSLFGLEFEEYVLELYQEHLQSRRFQPPDEDILPGPVVEGAPLFVNEEDPLDFHELP